MTTTTKKPKFISNTTPAGVAVYPKLNTPDTKFKPLGEYTCRLKLSAEDAQPLIDQYEGMLAKTFEEVKAELMAGDGKAKAKAKALKMAADKPFKPEFDDEGNETGNMLFNFKMPARVARDGKPDLVLKPDFFDAGGKPIKNAPEVWGGSKLAVAYQLRPFNTAIGVGLSLRLQAVQIIELRQGGLRDAAGYGFGASEGGYEADEGAAAPAGEDTPAEGGAPASGNEDF